MEIIRDNVSETTFNTWFADIKPLKYEGITLTIQVKSNFVYEFIEENFLDLLRSTIYKVMGHGTKLIYNILTDKENEMSTGEQDVSDDTASYVYLDSFDDFTEVTGKTPIVLPLPCAELYYEYDKTLDYIALYSFYETVDGQIIAYQIWDTESMVSSTLAGYSMYDANERIYYLLEENGDIYCLKIMEDSIYTIISKGNYSLESLVNMLKD